MKRVVATGRTVDEAVTSALVRLGVTRSQATIRVIHEPVSRLFGLIRSKEAEVEVTAMLSVEETAKDFLTEVLRLMGVDAKIRWHNSAPDEEAECIMDIQCDEKDLPVVIGRHGVTLDSLQYLVNNAANREKEKHLRFRVDAGDYRQRRKEGLCQVADRAVERALRTHKPIVLDSMPAAERKIIHTYLQDRSEVTTASEGTEPNRRVVVVPVAQAPSSARKSRVGSGARGSVRAK